VPGLVRGEVFGDIGVAIEVDHHILVVAELVDGRVQVALKRLNPFIAVRLADARRRELDVAAAHEEQQLKGQTNRADHAVAVSVLLEWRAVMVRTGSTAK